MSEESRDPQPPYNMPDSHNSYPWATTETTYHTPPAALARPGLGRTLWETFSRPTLAVFDWAATGASTGRIWILLLLFCIPAGAGSAALTLLSRDQVLQAQQQTLTSFGITTTLTPQLQQTLLIFDTVLLAIVAMLVAGLHYLCIWGAFSLFFRRLPRRPARETAYLLALASVPGAIAGAFALIDTFFVSNTGSNATANITIGLTITALALELYRLILITQALRSAVLIRNARITAGLWTMILLVSLPFLMFLSAVGG